jgi:hypothetical protein
MIELFEPRGFAGDRRVRADATRAGILDGIHQMTADADRRGGLLQRTRWHGPGQRTRRHPLPDLQVIMPTDYDDSRPGDYRALPSFVGSVTSWSSGGSPTLALA